MKLQAATSITTLGNINRHENSGKFRSGCGLSIRASYGPCRSNVCSVNRMGQTDTDAAAQTKITRALGANRGQKIHDTSAAWRSSQSLS